MEQGLKKQNLYHQRVGHALEIDTHTEDRERGGKAKWKDSSLVISVGLFVLSRISFLIFLYFEGTQFTS